MPGGYSLPGIFMEVNMKKVAEVFYKIGRILTYVCLGIFAVLAICGIVVTAVGAAGMVTEPNDEYAEYASYLMYVGIYLLSIGIIFTVIYIALAIIQNIAKRRIANYPTSRAWHIVLIVFGAVSGNECFAVGGILSIIDISVNGGDNTVIEETSKEEDGEEVVSETSDFE